MVYVREQKIFDTLPILWFFFSIIYLTLVLKIKTFHATAFSSLLSCNANYHDTTLERTHAMFWAGMR